MYLNQSFEEILSLLITLFILFLISVLISILFLKIKNETEKGIFKKAIIPNFIFFSISNILYQIAIEKGINISVFSPNENSEIFTIIICLSLVLIIISFTEICISKLIFKSELKKNYYILLCLLNILTYTIIFFSFYPKSYVDKNILSYNRYIFKPNKTELKLFDNSIVKIDNACSSEDIYKISKTNSYFIFRIPIKQIGTNRMLYSFEILENSLNEGFGESENCKEISISKLENEVKVVFEQKNTDPNIGWKKPIITDTIIFKKIKTENRKPGYYGDTNCDCIQK
jgi:hypothetical protein